MTGAILPSPAEIDQLIPTPGSVTWRVAGDGRLLAGAGYALLLQVAHPTVGAGVTQFSDFASDPWGRLLRTLDYVNGTVYGGPALAAAIGRRVRNVHRGMRGVRPDGEPYNALEPEAFAWVHATLAAAIVDGHDRFGSPLSVREREQLWTEWRLLGRLVGVRSRDLPETWQGFRSYFDAMIAERLEHTETVDEVLRTLGRPIAPPIPRLPPGAWSILRSPIAAQLRLTTIGLLGPELRDRFGLRWSPAQAAGFRALGSASRAATPLLPTSIRHFGPAYVRWRQAALQRGDVAAHAPAAHATA